MKNANKKKQVQVQQIKQKYSYINALSHKLYHLNSNKKHNMYKQIDCLIIQLNFGKRTFRLSKNIAFEAKQPKTYWR